MSEIFPLAEGITVAMAESVEMLKIGEPCELLDRVTPTTAELLKFWFQGDYCTARTHNFHDGQRDAILAIIWAHEVLGSTSPLDLYEKVRPDAMLANGMLGELTGPSNGHPKYAAKMATGTGKTWVVNAMLVWQFLNALAAPEDPRFTRNFLVVAPGLIVYERLLDSFLGRRAADGVRDPSTSDIASGVELFVPDVHRAVFLKFLAGSVVEKQDIGLKATGSGVVAITNWHRLTGDESDDFVDGENEARIFDEDIDARAAALSFVPLSPGVNAGNSLDTLDRRNQRGVPMRWLSELPDLMVINDEAHHVHSSRKGDEATEVEWQRSLNALAAGKGRRFVQLDFSATPYNEQRGQKRWFPHIVVDFALNTAVAKGLVKSIAFDRRQEVAAIPNSELDFRAVRSADGGVSLSDGQRTMLRAGLRRLEIIQGQFASQDPSKHPKMLVVVEDTTISPKVEEFLLAEGLSAGDFLSVDSGKKASLSPREWDGVRDQLFDLDERPAPRVIISVLMLREGFDVNSICVIVPLRAANSGILAEQTIGRGLRLMWRNDSAVEEQKAENRARLLRHQAPHNLYDVLFVVEHPRFDDLYEELLGEGLISTISDDGPRATGDTERIDLKSGFEDFDFHIPFVVQEPQEQLAPPVVDVAALPVSTIPVQDLLGYVPDGDRFMAEDYATKTRFGAFTIDGARMTSRGYNEFLAKLVNRIGGSIERSFTDRGTLRQRPGAEPFPNLTLQIDRPTVMRVADRYIRTRFFTADFDPLHGEQWRVLMISDVADQLAGNLARAVIENLSQSIVGQPEVRYRSLSEVDWIAVRRGFAVDVAKSIYPRLPYPSSSGSLERLFMTWADADSEVEALVKIHEYRHSFLRRPYIKADGMPAQYSPDFLVRTADCIYVVETKGQGFLSEANVLRKRMSALQWCDQLNALPPHLRSDRTWRYALLGENTVKEWEAKGMSASALLAYARLRPPENSRLF